MTPLATPLHPPPPHLTSSFPTAVDKNRVNIRADKLQQLHTLANLAQLLGPEGHSMQGVVAPTVRDAQLARQAQELRCMLCSACCAVHAVLVGMHYGWQVATGRSCGKATVVQHPALR